MYIHDNPGYKWNNSRSTIWSLLHGRCFVIPSASAKRPASTNFRPTSPVVKHWPTHWPPMAQFPTGPNDHMENMHVNALLVTVKQHICVHQPGSSMLLLQPWFHRGQKCPVGADFVQAGALSICSSAVTTSYQGTLSLSLTSLSLDLGCIKLWNPLIP